MKTKSNWGLGLIPSGALSALDREWDNLFDSFFDVRPLSSWFKSSGYPVNALTETENGKKFYVLEVALAGVEKERVKVSVTKDGTGNWLTLNVSKSEEKKDSVYQGLTNKQWSTSYFLPEGYDVENVTSSLTNGLLRVKVPVVEPPKPEVREIEVTVE